MKKVIFFIAIVFSIAIVYGQIGGGNNLDSLDLRHYEEQYLLPTIMNDCNEISLDILSNADDSIINGQGGYYLCHVINRGYIGLSSWAKNYDSDFPSTTNILPDFIQPYYSDTSITIIGLSGYIGNRNQGFEGRYDYDTNFKFYLELWDSSLTNVIRRVDVTHRDYFCNHTPTYTEMFFDNPINMQGKFYIMYHTPDTVASGTKLNIVASLYSAFFCLNNVGDMYPLQRKRNQENWEAIWANQYDGFAPNNSLITMLYLFPILGEYDPNVEEWHGVGLNETKDISNFTHVFPNPAKEEININCGYKIKTLQVFDEQGKLLFEKEVNAYNYQINLDSYPTGTYFIKVLTNSGQTTKKVVKE